MPDGFVPLAAFVRAARGEKPRAASSARAEIARGPTVIAPPGAEPDGIARELGLMRIAVLEAYARASVRLLEELAREVLARELALAPVDLQALVDRALAEFSENEPVALRVAPADSDRVCTSLPVRVDPALQRGDLVVDVRDGSLESRFTLRSAAALERALDEDAA